MNKYEIKRIRTKESHVVQPAGAKDGILPTHPFRMYVVGASGSGKTNFVLNLLSRDDMYKEYFHSILVVSPTARHLDATYDALRIPERNFFGCDSAVLETIRDIQEERSVSGRETPRVLLLLDDIVSYKDFCTSDILLQFAVMSRHWNVSMIILSQAYHRIPKAVRLQMSSVVYFKGSNKELEVLAQDFGAPGLSLKQFISRINYATSKRFNFFFIDLHRPIENRYRMNLTESLVTN